MDFVIYWTNFRFRSKIFPFSALAKEPIYKKCMKTQDLLCLGSHPTASLLPITFALTRRWLNYPFNAFTPPLTYFNFANNLLTLPRRCGLSLTSCGTPHHQVELTSFADASTAGQHRRFPNPCFERLSEAAKEVQQERISDARFLEN